MAGVTGSLPPNGSPGDPDDAGLAGTESGFDASADSGTETGSASGFVSGEWVEVRLPDSDPEPEFDPEPRSRVAPLAASLFGGSLVLVLLGSVLPLFEATLRVSFGSASSIAVAAWRFTSSSLSPDRDLITRAEPSPVPVGYPLVVAAVLLVIAVVLWLRAGWRPTSVRAARIAGLVAATFLAALVFALGMFELAWQNLVGSGDDTGGIGGLATGVGEGFWLLLLGAIAAVVATVLTFRVPVRPDQDPPPADWTPGEQDDERPPGQPAEWPVVAVLPADERSNW